MFLEICMQIHSMVFALSRQITINFLCAGNKVFVKYQAQGGGVTPNPLRTLLTGTTYQQLYQLVTVVQESMLNAGFS